MMMTDSVYMQPSVDGTMLVTVYRTNVSDLVAAKRLLESLVATFPGAQFSFDVWDPDRVFRMESATDIGNEVADFVARKGYYCELL